jgi:transcriptional regulator with XRE-family HTH domain
VRDMEGDQLTELAGKVRDRREDLRLSVRAAAKRAGISDHTWRRVEEGDPSIGDTTLDGVAAALDLPAQRVYEWAGRRYRPMPASRVSQDEDLLEEIDAITLQLASLRARILGKQRNGDG